MSTNGQTSFATRSISVATEVVSALEAFYRETAGVVGEVPLHEPCFRGNESRYLSKCTESGWVSSVGAYVDESETAIAKKCNTAYGVAAASGTAALHATGGVL